MNIWRLFYMYTLTEATRKKKEKKKFSLLKCIQKSNVIKKNCVLVNAMDWSLQTIYNMQLVMNRRICFRSRHRFTIPWLIFKAVLRHWSPPDCWLDAQKLLRKTRVSMSPPLLLRISGFCHIFNAWKRVVIRNHLSKK